ncbi:DUF6932 family protein [Sandaracinobacteroides saxicola]|uniref:Uncharacterized protein n=1 Tax=Sandaracinobacteroides saxicola TaxID=2759707 RepID=A0A7G5IFH5_9SPHN|nr:hypothetical protein [Sandaracinobacteroides saxicola]QMW22117.1 hypothetical protein H3309_12160 [Sandaracinobacteroides saxicola]
MTDTSPTCHLQSPADAPILAESSPHMLDFGTFADRFATSPARRHLLRALADRLGRLRDHGVEPLFLLVGGGFVRAQHEPADLDALVGYRLGASGVMTDSMVALLRERGSGLDLRFVAADGRPELLVRMACFFHTLYQSRDKGYSQPSFLVTIGMPT